MAVQRTQINNATAALDAISTAIDSLENTSARLVRDNDPMHNDTVVPGTGTGMDVQSATYGNLMVGGGGNAGVSPNRIVGEASLRTLIGGYDNSLGASLAAAILHGQHVVIDALSTHAIIVGGSSQIVTDSDYASTTGGTGNAIGATGQPGNYAAITGGQTNTVRQYYGFVGAGHNNLVGYNGVGTGASGILAGEDIVVYGKYAGAMGKTNLAGTAVSPTYGDYSVMAGLSNQIGQAADASYSALFGRDHRSDVRFGGVIGGQGARPGHKGAQAWAMGYFATPGDTQVSRAVLRRQTVNTAVATNLLVDNTDRLVLPDDTTWFFKAKIVGRRTDGGAEQSGVYIIEGVISRASGVATTAVLGTPTVTTVYEDVAGWNVDVAADTTNGNLQIRATGGSAVTVNWCGLVEWVAVTG